MPVQEAPSERVVFEVVFDHGRIDGAFTHNVGANRGSSQFEWHSSGEIYISEVAETIAEKITEFVQQVRATCRLTDGVYRSPMGPFGLRCHWLAIEWLARILENQLRTGGYIVLHHNNPGWGRHSPWPRGRKYSEDEQWDKFKFMPHLHRDSALTDPDGPVATGLVAPVGGSPTTGEGSRRLNVVMSLMMDCPIRGSGVSVEELDRIDAMVWELAHDLAKIDDRPPADLIDDKVAAGIVDCEIKTMSRWIDIGKIRSWGPDKLVSQKEVEEKHEANEWYDRPPKGGS